MTSQVTRIKIDKQEQQRIKQFFNDNPNKEACPVVPKQTIHVNGKEYNYVEYVTRNNQ